MKLDNVFDCLALIGTAAFAASCNAPEALSGSWVNANLSADIAVPITVTPGPVHRTRRVFERIPESVQRVCQLTGEVDHMRGGAAFNATESRFGLAGTDLGINFLHKGKLFFLFGDTRGTPGGSRTSSPWIDADSIAYTTDWLWDSWIPNAPDFCAHLTFLTGDFRVPGDTSGSYLGLNLDDNTLPGFQVPSGGFSDGTTMYAFFAIADEDGRTAVGTPGDLLSGGRTILAASDDDGRHFHTLAEVSRAKLVNVAARVVDRASSIQGLPSWWKADAPVVLFFFTGRYGRSYPSLAVAPLVAVGAPALWVYYAGSDAQGRPQFVRGEDNAVPITETHAPPDPTHDGLHQCAGELSVAYSKDMGRYVMLHGCGQEDPGHPWANPQNKRGIVYRVAEQPWGPWTEPESLLDTRANEGTCSYVQGAAGSCVPAVCDPAKTHDCMVDRNGESGWGGVYAPYLVEPYLQGDSTHVSLYYVMSTWNPYNTVLMRTDLRIRDVRTPPALGDVNGDRMADLMWVGGDWWNTLPVAVSRGGGAFTVTNNYVGSDVDSYLRQNGGGLALLGDFNRDQLADVALLPTGNDNWGTIRIEFSNGPSETFRSTQKRIDNYADIPFTEFATQLGVQATTGDFNGDGATDIALLDGVGWNTIPVAFSNFDGSFHATNNPSELQSLVEGGEGQQRGLYTLAAGHFDYDTNDDLVLLPHYGYNPGRLLIARSLGDGSFSVTNTWNSEVASLAKESGAKPLVGDYNNDGCADIAFINGLYYSPVKIAFGDCNYHFVIRTPEFTYETPGDFPLWAIQSGATWVGVTPIALDFNGDGQTDLALTGGQGWNTIPVALSNLDSNGFGSFKVTNTTAPFFAQVATQPGAQLVRP